MATQIEIDKWTDIEVDVVGGTVWIMTCIGTQERTIVHLPLDKAKEFVVAINKAIQKLEGF